MANLGCGAALVAAPVLIALVTSLANVVIDDPLTGPCPDQVDGIDPVLLNAYVHGARML